MVDLIKQFTVYSSKYERDATFSDVQTQNNPLCALLVSHGSFVWLLS